ncbi:hypothetical protein F7R21_05590 [Burkholderia latens]|uniref:Uncharacterized protein n=1 Tax=Burkholderia latens TaxID=488446 RepID=A0A6H9SRY5_9BURK|nr:hypothetical protein F7R21_05590 [Burkholderia latens]
MHVACKQCSENPPVMYFAFVANCNPMRLRPRRDAALRNVARPCGPRDSVRLQISPRGHRSVLPAPASTARMLA